MSVAIVRPNETVDLGGASVTGAANAHTATSDDSDSSYVDVAGVVTTLGFAEPTIPGTAVLKDVRLRTRNAKSGSLSPTLIATPTTGDGVGQTITWTTPTTTTLAVFAADAFNVADVELDLAQFSDASPRVYELYLDFAYVEQPVVIVVAPTGTLTETNFPTVEWGSDVDSSGGNWTHSEVKVFDAATFGDFSTVNPDSSTPFTESGEVASTSPSYEVEEVLPNDTYRVYVRIAQTVNGALHWSEWDFEAFTIDAPAPGVPTIALVPQPACGRMRIDLDPRDQLCTNPEAETDTAGWTPASLPTFERVTSLPTLSGLPAGVTTAFHAVGNADNDHAYDEIAVESGKTYRFSLYAYIDTSTATGILLQITNAAAVSKAISATLSTLDNWARLDVAVTADETGTWRFKLRQTGGGATDFYFTAVLIEESATLGEYFAEVTGAFQAQRSDDAGATWADLRTVDGGGRRERSSNPLTTLLDWEAPNGATATYRARAIHSFAGGDAFSDWVEDEDSWESADAWLKHPTDPTLNQIVTVYSQPGERTQPRVGVHNVLGRSDPIITSDKPGPTTGELVFDLSTGAEQAALDALRDTLSPLLLQMPPAHYWPDRWLVFTGDHERSRIVDKLEVEDRHDSLPWTKVKRPNGNLLAWPAVTCP